MKGNFPNKDSTNINSSYIFNDKHVIFPNNNNSFIGYNQTNPNTSIYQDSQLSNITLRKLNPTQNNNVLNNKTIISHNNIISTPENKPKKDYDATLNSKIKKTKKRDCTPHDQDDDTCSFYGLNNENLNDSHYNNNYGLNNDTRMTFGPSTSNMFSRDTLLNITNMTNFNNISNIKNNQTVLNETYYGNNHNNNSYLTFTKQKSRFLNELDRNLDFDQNVQIDTEEEKEVKNYLKGSFMLEKLENENAHIDNIYSNLFQGKEILQKIAYEVVKSFFDGYNNRINTFYKYLVS